MHYSKSDLPLILRALRGGKKQKKYAPSSCQAGFLTNYLSSQKKTHRGVFVALTILIVHIFLSELLQEPETEHQCLDQTGWQLMSLRFMKKCKCVMAVSG